MGDYSVRQLARKAGRVCHVAVPSGCLIWTRPLSLPSTAQMVPAKEPLAILVTRALFGGRCKEAAG